MATSRTLTLPNATEFHVDLVDVHIDNENEVIILELIGVHKTNYNVFNRTLSIQATEFDSVGRGGIPGGSVDLQDAVTKVMWTWIAANVTALGVPAGTVVS